jgi:RNA polymerase sigma-70 factor (ECF subfamily)
MAHCRHVTDAFRQGAAAWPTINLAAEDFARYLAARNFPPDPPHPADVYLACACVLGLPAALRIFETTYMAQLPAYVSRLRPGPELLDELGQHLREKLLVGPAPKLMEYSGKGKLAAWLRVVSVRAAIDLMRARGTPPAAPALSIAATGTSPELRALRNRYRPRFEAAFAAALHALPAAQRELMRQHFVEGLTLEQIGQRLGVNRSTIMRRLNACTQGLLQHIRQQLGDELGVTTNELESLTDMLRSDLQLSLSEHLKTQK